MIRLARPPAEVPTLTQIVYPPVIGEPTDSSSNATAALSRELQKKIVRQVVQRIGKSLKVRLRKVGEQPIGESRNRLIASLCGEIQHVVGDVVNQAFAHQEKEYAVRPKNRQKKPLEIPQKSCLQIIAICEGKPPD